MPHHREGVQKQLDNAHEEGATIISDEEKAVVASGEKEISPGLTETIARLKEKGYLDTSFEGKEIHELNILPLTKDEALAGYGANSVMLTGYIEEQSVWPYRYKTMMYTESARNPRGSKWTLRDVDSRPIGPKGAIDYRYERKADELKKYHTGGGVTTWVWDEVEKKMPYTTPEAGVLDVMIMNFNKDIVLNDALVEMSILDVRPLTYEELIQYGIAHPSHQEKKVLAGLGSKHVLTGISKAEGPGDTEQFVDQLSAPALLVGDAVYGRGLSAINLEETLNNDNVRFLVVRK